MAKPEWGTKRICGGCGAPFYDLMRDPIVCPKCGVTFDPDQMVRLKRSRGAAPETRAKPVVVAPKAKSADDELGEVTAGVADDDIDADDDDDAVLVDDDELSDDDDLDEIVDGVGKDSADD